MINVDRALQRIGMRRPGFSPGNLRPQVFTNNFTLTSGAQAANQNITFPAGAVILGIMAGAWLAGQAATQQLRKSLEMFTIAIAMHSDGRAIIGSAEGLGSAIFGDQGNMFPPVEIFLQEQATLLYSITNVTSSTISVTIAHHALVPGNVS